MQLVALGGIGKTARTSSPCRLWRFSSFARGQYPRTAPVRKIRNLSHFLKVLQNKSVGDFNYLQRLIFCAYLFYASELSFFLIFLFMNINIIILIITQHISAVACDQIMPSSPISLFIIKSIGT